MSGRRATGRRAAGRRAARRLTALGLLAGLLSAPQVARAAVGDPPPGSNTPGGYAVEVEITFTGEAAPGGRTTRSVQVRPTCWWAAAEGPYTDAVAMLAWYDGVTSGQQTRGVYGEYGPRIAWEQIAEAESSGAGDYSWYKVTCLDPDDYEDYGIGSYEGVDPIPGIPENWVTYLYRPFAAGEAVPAPRVSPEELAIAAREVMVIPEPVTRRNPQIRSAGGPTLVGLPTWFWVEDPDAVGGTDGDGDREITAAVDDVWATVTAHTGGLSLSSPAGATTCAPARALTEYTPGAAEGSACTVQFSRASVGYPGGYPVVASTAWGATWVGSDGTDGTLEGLTRSITDNVPVAEVQNIVTR